MVIFLQTHLMQDVFQGLNNLTPCLLNSPNSKPTNLQTLKRNHQEIMHH